VDLVGVRHARAQAQRGAILLQLDRLMRQRPATGPRCRCAGPATISGRSGC
jgi:hypothetical protein